MAKPKKLKRVVVYARVSTAEQAAKDLSIPAQLDALTAYASTKGAEVVKSFKELGASGRTGHRPVFREMLAFVADRFNAIDAILVYQTSRFFRDAVEARSLKVALRKQGVGVISICQETDDGPMGQFMEGMFELVDQYESEVNGMRTTAAMRKNAQNGFVNGARAPYGYTSEHVEVGGQRKRRLVPHPQEAPAVLEVFRAYVTGQGAKSVAMALNDTGRRYRKGARWTKDHVLRALGETAYTGTYYWGQTDTRTGEKRDESEWIAVAVEPLVPSELFQAVQELRKQRDPSQVKGRTLSSSLLLAGVARCAHCGSTLGLETSGKVNTDGDRPHRYYNCRKFLKSGKAACPGSRVPEAVMDKAVLEHLADKVFTNERCRKIMKDVVEETGLLRERTSADRENLRIQLVDAQRRLCTWQDAFEQRPTDADVILPRLREWQSKCEELESSLTKIVPLRAPPPHLYTEATLERFRSMLREVFVSGQTSMTKAYLRFLVERIEVSLSGDRQLELNIVGKSGAAIQLMASLGADESTKHQPGSFSTPEEIVKHPVLGSVGTWLRK
jgi:site-specific DNA recombinase